MYHLYILYSAAIDKYYIGHIGDEIHERIRKHNSNHKGFTGGYGDWTLVYQEQYPKKNEAVARERQVKAWKSRKEIDKLIQKN